jgi:hypothetical protein
MENGSLFREGGAAVPHLLLRGHASRTRASSCGRGRVAWPRLRTVIITYSLDLCYAGRLGRLPSFGRGASGYASMTAAAALAAPTAAEVHHGLLLLNKLL